MTETHYYQTKNCQKCGNPMRSFLPKHFDYDVACGNCGEYVQFIYIDRVYWQEGKMIMTQEDFDDKYSDKAKKCK